MSKQTGLIQVYTGSGKGKSTAAFGLAIRAAGSGLQVAIIQFMKPGEGYGELESFKRFPEISVFSYGGNKFLTKGGKPDQQNIELAKLALVKAAQIMAEGAVDILIFDELNNAIFFDLISEEAALALIDKKPDDMELIITGRNATQAIIDRADLVTEMKEIKHPYDLGVEARKGIEY